MKPEIRLIVFNTYFSVIAKKGSSSLELHNNLSWYLNTLETFDFVKLPKSKKVKRVPAKVLYFVEELNGEVIYSFSLAYLKNIITILNTRYGVTIKDYVTFKQDVPIKTLTCKLKSEFQPRDYQVKYIDACCNPKTGVFTLIDLRTGMGKSLIGTFSTFKLGYRTAIVVLPKYIEKWIDDIKKYTTCEDKKIYVVQGSDSLRQLVEDVQQGIDYDFIIFSIRTLYLYRKDYDGKGVHPNDIFNKLKVGTILSDESHQETGALFDILTLSNVKKVIGMSATFISTRNNEKLVQDSLFPEYTRVSGLVEYSKYIKMKTITYNIDNRFRVKYMSGHGYSHLMFEQSMTKNRHIREEYCDLVYSVLEEHMKRRKPGDKALIFFSTVDMCTWFCNYLKGKKDMKDLRIERYTQEDDYEVMMKGDIICSTVISSGTAIDFPNLITVIQTITMLSPKANLQAIGRLRYIEGKDTVFYKIYCNQIKRQKEIHYSSIGAYKSIVSEFKESHYHHVLSPFIKPKSFLERRY